MNPRPSMLKPAAIGGAVFGLLAGLPLINYVNCACCALVIGGGFFGGWLYSRACADAGVIFSPGNGALLGLTAAPFYALLATISGALFHSSSPEEIDQMVEGLEQANLPPEVIDWAVRMAEGGGGPVGWLIGFVITVAIAAVFSTIGGLIAGAAFKVTPAESTPAAPPPPASE